MLDIQQNIPLRNYCTFMIGGPAAFFINWKNHEEITEILKFAEEKKLKPFVFGGGTNLLFPDEGLNTLVIRCQTSEISHQNQDLQVDPGVSWVKLHKYLKEHKLYGLEAFSGLPGTLGGATFGNAGCHGTEMKDVVTKIEVIDPETQEFQIIQNKDLEYGYRTSYLKKHRNLIITKVWLKISHNPEDNTGDPEHFAEFRKQNQPTGLTTGSFFKNPEGDYAGRLIDDAGLKGFQIGGIKLSEKHANFFINTGNATEEEVMQLKNKVIAEVEAKFGITLEPEVQIIKEITA